MKIKSNMSKAVSFLLFSILILTFFNLWSPGYFFRKIILIGVYLFTFLIQHFVSDLFGLPVDIMMVFMGFPVYSCNSMS